MRYTYDLIFEFTHEVTKTTTLYTVHNLEKLNFDTGNIQLEPQSRIHVINLEPVDEDENWTFVMRLELYIGTVPIRFQVYTNRFYVKTKRGTIIFGEREAAMKEVNIIVKNYN